MKPKRDWPHLNFKFNSSGEFVNKDWSEPRTALTVALFQAKYDKDAEAFLKFWLAAIEYDEATQEKA